MLNSKDRRNCLDCKHPSIKLEKTNRYTIKCPIQKCEVGFQLAENCNSYEQKEE